MTLISLGSSSDSHINTESLLYDQLCIFKSGCSSIENRPPPFIEKENPIATYIYSKSDCKYILLFLFDLLLLIPTSSYCFSCFYCCNFFPKSLLYKYVNYSCLLYRLCLSCFENHIKNLIYTADFELGNQQ